MEASQGGLEASVSGQHHHYRYQPLHCLSPALVPWCTYHSTATRINRSMKRLTKIPNRFGCLEQVAWLLGCTNFRNTWLTASTTSVTGCVLNSLPDNCYSTMVLSHKTVINSSAKVVDEPAAHQTITCDRHSKAGRTHLVNRNLRIYTDSTTDARAPVHAAAKKLADKGDARTSSRCRLSRKVYRLRMHHQLGPARQFCDRLRSCVRKGG
jgi:hypothetical protein